MSWRRVMGLTPVLFLLACSSIQAPPRTVSLAVRGSVHGGQQPVAGSAIQLYAVGLSGGGSSSTPLLATTVSTDAGGSFSITGNYTCPTAESQVYVVARGGNPGLSAGSNNPAISLAAALGTCGNLSTSTFVSLNEVTTVALAVALAPFESSIAAIGSTPSDAVLLDSAFAAAGRYASTTSGTAPGANLPAGVEVPAAEINTLADILSTCINSAGGTADDNTPCGTLFALAAASGLSAPVDTFGAAVRIADTPTLSTAALFDLVSPTSSFQPELATVPPDLPFAPR